MEKGITQFIEQDYPEYSLFLSDSGPPENEGIASGVLERVIGAHPSLEGRVHYRYIAQSSGPLSRGEAMNLGTSETESDIVLFLHIDCKLPNGALHSIAQAWRNGVKGGGFLKEYTGKAIWSPLQATERYLNWVRTVVTRQVVGTNAIFLDRQLAVEHPYEGNFLEDVELSDWMKERLTRHEFQIIRDYVGVSAQKYTKHGEVSAIAINASVMLLYRLFSTSPDLLRTRLYRRKFSKGWKFWPELLGTTWSLILGKGNHDN